MSLHSMPAQHVHPAEVMPEPKLPFHAQPVGACLALLKTSIQGLGNDEAQQRLSELAKAKTAKLDSPKAATLFLSQVKKAISLLFIGAAGLSFTMGKPVDGIMILVAMFANAGVQGLIQWKSMQHQSAATDTEHIRCSVRRNGEPLTVPANELVPGDILIIANGQVMPADARLISSYQLQVDESALTGESVLVPKNANDILHPQEDLTARTNMLFAGTQVKTGKGEAIVTALGTQTVMGHIAALANKTEKRESPFTRRLNKLSLKLFIAVVAVTALVIGVGLYRHLPVSQLIQVGLIMGIAAFPETIPGLVSVILSAGISRLNEKKVLIKNFQVLETLGDLTVICTDKTGTLTENYLLLDQLFLPGLGAVAYDPQWQAADTIPHRSIQEFLRVGRLNNGTMVEGLRSAIMGDPIDVALYRAAPASLEAGYHPRIAIPFDPVHLRSATICDAPGKQIISMIKGAPESVLETCKYVMMPDGSIQELTLNQRSELLMQNRKLAYDNNLRIVGFAQKLMAEDDQTGPYSDAIFIGWVCLMDPPKAGVKEAITALQKAGSRLMMITGDQKATAEITASELGIIRRKSDEAWLRSDLEAWDQPGIPETVKVFARTKPEEKLAIVESLQRGGQVVAMVGDGVNDSPALQKSDVAVAMGLQGSQAAKDSADIILLNDRLEGIMLAIEESRILRRKTQSCLRYLISCNLGLILFIAASVAGGLGLTLNVVQLLWLNLIIVSIPAMVLAIEPHRGTETSGLENDGMDDAGKWQYKKQADTDNAPHPSHMTEPMDTSHLILAGYWGLIIMAAGLGTYLLCSLGLKQPAAVASTAAFCTLALSQTFNLFNVQAVNAGENRRNFMSELASTPITWVVIGMALVLQALTVYLPMVNNIFGTVPMPVTVAFIPVGVGLGAILFSLKTTKVG